MQGRFWIFYLSGHCIPATKVLHSQGWPTWYLAGLVFLGTWVFFGGAALFVVQPLPGLPTPFVVFHFLHLKTCPNCLKQCDVSKRVPLCVED